MLGTRWVTHRFLEGQLSSHCPVLHPVLHLHIRDGGSILSPPLEHRHWPPLCPHLGAPPPHPPPPATPPPCSSCSHLLCTVKPVFSCSLGWDTHLSLYLVNSYLFTGPQCQQFFPRERLFDASLLPHEDQIPQCMFSNLLDIFMSLLELWSNHSLEINGLPRISNYTEAPWGQGSCVSSNTHASMTEQTAWASTQLSLVSCVTLSMLFSVPQFPKMGIKIVSAL